MRSSMMALLNFGKTEMGNVHINRNLGIVLYVTVSVSCFFKSHEIHSIYRAIYIIE